MQYFIIAVTLVLVCLGNTAVNAFIAGSRFISRTYTAEAVESVQVRQSVMTHSKTWLVMQINIQKKCIRPHFMAIFFPSIRTNHANIRSSSTLSHMMSNAAIIKHKFKDEISAFLEIVN
jgi:hypothetical protein